MKSANHILTVDSHIMGEPLRTVIGGIPFLRGSSINEKKEYFANNFDYIRSALILEPRGHDNMFGAVLCEPSNKLADVGIFFMHSDGYLNMCGHGIIGAVTTIIERGLIDKEIKDNMEIVLETPSGLIRAYANIEGGLVKDVAFRNVPSFVLYSDLKVNFPGKGDISIDIVYAGNYFAIVSVKELSVEISKKHLPELIKYGMEIRRIVNDNLNIYHPLHENLNKVELAEIYDINSEEKNSYKNCVVFGKNQVDRSPCGSGTSAILALSYKNDKIKLNELLINESIIGTRFSGKIIKEVKVGDFEGIIPEIRGKAYIIGNHHFIIDSDDPLHNGITLNC